MTSEAFKDAIDEIRWQFGGVAAEARRYMQDPELSGKEVIALEEFAEYAEWVHGTIEGLKHEKQSGLFAHIREHVLGIERSARCS